MGTAETFTLNPGLRLSAGPIFVCMAAWNWHNHSDNASPGLELKGRAGTLSTTKMGIEVGHPPSTFPLFCRWVFIGSAQVCTTQNWLLFSLFGEHYANKNSYTLHTSSTRQVSFLPFHTSTLLKPLVISISGRVFIFIYGLHIWEYCFPKTSGMCS